MQRVKEERYSPSDNFTGSDCAEGKGKPNAANPKQHGNLRSCTNLLISDVTRLTFEIGFQSVGRLL